MPALTLQWHITGSCNLRCTHCYEPDAAARAGLSLPECLDVLSQFETLLDRLSLARGHINLTGGEPFLHPGFFDLLSAISARRRRLTFGILSNGSTLDVPTARRLRRLRPEFVQLSLEGMESTHDAIRGAGSFRRTTSATRALNAARIPVLLSFTAHQANFREFPEVARLARRLRVRRVWTDRLIPAGRGAGLAPLTRAETREYCELIGAARRESQRAWLGRTEVSAARALQFNAASGCAPYRCNAGDGLVCILPDGSLYPCRRLALFAGNVFDSSLAGLYEESDVLRGLRARRPAPPGCEACPQAPACRGGLRCLAYALTGDPFRPDPGCWRAAVTSPAGQSTSAPARTPAEC